MGLLGSTEWAEKHRDDLARKASPTSQRRTGRAARHCGSTPCRPSSTVARDVADPAAAHERARGRKDAKIDQARSEGDKPPSAAGRIPIEAGRVGLHCVHRPPGHRVFEPGLRGDGGRHLSLNYDTFNWYTTFSTAPSRTAPRSKVIGTALMRLADADVLPFEFTVRRTLSSYCDRSRSWRRTAQAGFKPLRESLRAWPRGPSLEQALGGCPRGGFEERA